MVASIFVAQIFQNTLSRGPSRISELLLKPINARCVILRPLALSLYTGTLQLRCIPKKHLSEDRKAVVAELHHNARISCLFEIPDWQSGLLYGLGLK